MESEVVKVECSYSTKMGSCDQVFYTTTKDDQDIEEDLRCPYCGERGHLEAIEKEKDTKGGAD